MSRVHHWEDEEQPDGDSQNPAKQVAVKQLYVLVVHSVPLSLNALIPVVTEIESLGSTVG